MSNIAVGPLPLRNVILTSASPVDSFISEVVTYRDGEADKPIRRIVNPLVILLNQKRIDGHSVDAIAKWLEGSGVPSPDTSKIKDSDLFKFIKSRYIQTPSEVQNWIEYLDQTGNDLVTDLKEKLTPVSSPVPDPSPAPAPSPVE